MQGKIGSHECPFREDAGSYYNPLPWMTCSKMPSLVSNENDMCDIDAGKECHFIEEEDVRRIYLPRWATNQS